MAKKLSILGIIIILSIGVMYFFYGNKKSKNQRMTGNQYLSFVELPESIFAEAGELQVLKDEINDKTLLGYEQERRELIYASAFKQFVLDENRNDDVTFFTNKPSRSLSDIFVRYSVVPKSSHSIKFAQPKDEVLIQVGNDRYSLNDVKKDNYYWGALKSKIFQRSIDVVKEMMVRKSIIKEAVAGKMSAEEYIEKKILKGVRNKETPEQILTVENFVLNNLLNLPIKINLEVPDFQYEIKPDWTLSFGSLESEVKVIIFSDFLSIPGRLLLDSIVVLAERYPQVYFGFRPLFFKGDRHQRMIAEFSFCAWEYSKDKFWEFLPQAARLSKKNLENQLYQLTEEKALPLIPIKTCFLDQVYKDVVDYHISYGEYLGISYGPLVFVDGEILEGVVTQERINKVLKRKTWLRDPKNRDVGK